MNIPSGIDANIANIKLKKLDDSIIYNKDLYTRIQNTKKKIDDVEEEWDKMKKIANPYELIHSSNNKEKKEKSISKFNPLSRSFFKLAEILKKYSILDSKNISLTMAGIAEGPGGFIETILYYRKLHNIKYRDNLYGITLFPNNKYIPNWKKINDKYKRYNICTEYGDIYDINIINNFKSKFSNNKADIVTADGGFDYSVDFNNQELVSSRILLSEIVLCFNIQKINGTFIIKFFDFFNNITIKLLYLIYMHYEKFDIYKPLTSRPANSEKYIIARNFKGIDNNILSSLQNIIINWNNSYTNFDIDGINIDNKFYNIIKEYNINFVNNQIKYIDRTLYYINNKIDKEEYKNIITKQVHNAIRWVKEHNLEMNINSKYYKKFIILSK